ncbi:MAG: hypothetical protein H7829_12215 [Magnetococcus sp. THC-1_WYH]
MAKGVRIHERWIFRASDSIWADTMRHRQWMMATFGIPVGVEESWPQPQVIPDQEMFQVLFYGTYQSMMATRYKKYLVIEIYIISIAYT